MSTDTSVGYRMTKKRDDRAVKIAKDLAVKAKVIAESKDISLAEYLSGLLRGPIEKDWPKAIKKLDTSGQFDSEPD